MSLDEGIVLDKFKLNLNPPPPVIFPTDFILMQSFFGKGSKGTGDPAVKCSDVDWLLFTSGCASAKDHKYSP